MVDDQTDESPSEKKKAALRKKIAEVEDMINLLDKKIREKIESDIYRSKVASQTSERELEANNLKELRDLKDSYRRELADYKAELADLESEEDRLNSRFIKSTYNPR